MMLDYHFFELLRGFRNRVQLSQSVLAEQVGVSRQTLSAWETKRIPTRDMVQLLAETLELNGEETNQLLDSAGYALNALQNDTTEPSYDVQNNREETARQPDLLPSNVGKRPSIPTWSWIITASGVLLSLLFITDQLLTSNPAPAPVTSAASGVSPCERPELSELSGRAQVQHIKHAQRQLLKMGGEVAKHILDSGGVDGYFGSSATEAVKAYQQIAFPDQPTEWDGFIGPKTWSKLGCESGDHPKEAPDTLIVNGDFTDGLDGWNISNRSSQTVRVDTTRAEITDEARLCTKIVDAGKAKWDVVISQKEGIRLDKSTKYMLIFDVSSTTERELRVKIGRYDEPMYHTVALQTGRQTITHDYVQNEVDPAADFEFQLGAQGTGTLCFDHILLIPQPTQPLISR